MSDENKPRKVRIKDLKGGIIAIIIGIILTYLAVGYLAVIPASLALPIWGLLLLGIVLIIIGFIYIIWKAFRKAKG